MAELGRRGAEQLIKEILTEYARKIRSAKKGEYAEDIQQQLFNPKIDTFYKLAKSEDMDFYIFNRLNDEGIRQLLVGCRRLAKCYGLDSYGKIKNFTYEPESPKCRITADSDGKYTAGGSYTFILEGKEELEKKWYEPYSVAWHFYRENPGTGKYEETASKMDEARALADFDTWDRTFLVSEKGRYKVTATIFNQAITTGIRPDIVEVCELYFEAEDETDASIANLKDHEKVCRAMKLANYGDAFESLGMDIAAIALTLVAFVGIGVILKKVPAGKLKPFITKLAEKLALSELLTFFGTYGDAFDVAAFIGAVCDFYEQATNARNEMQLKTAGKSFERVVETFGLVAVMSFMNIVDRKMKKSDVENEIKSIDDIPQKTITVEDIIGKKANDLVEVPDEYVLFHYIDGVGITQTNIRRKNSTIGEFLFVDENNYIRRVSDVKRWSRSNTVGSTPTKASRTGKEIIERMKGEGKIRTDPLTGKYQVYSEKMDDWFDINDCDMSHKEACVTYWNREGRNYGPLSPEVREWMTKSDNYYLEYYGQNRSEGGKVSERYLSPTDNKISKENKNGCF